MMKKKVLIFLSVLTIIINLSSIALAGTVDPPPIREESIKIIKQI